MHLSQLSYSLAVYSLNRHGIPWFLFDMHGLSVCLPICRRHACPCHAWKPNARFGMLAFLILLTCRFGMLSIGKGSRQDVYKQAHMDIPVQY